MTHLARRTSSPAIACTADERSPCQLQVMALVDPLIPAHLEVDLPRNPPHTRAASPVEETAADQQWTGTHELRDTVAVVEFDAYHVFAGENDPHTLPVLRKQLLDTR